MSRRQHHRSCVECGAAFVTSNVRTICCGRVCGNLRGKRRGDEARAANTVARLTRECKACGTSFVMPGPNGKALRGEVNAGQFCSRRCAHGGVVYASRLDSRRARKQRRKARERGATIELFGAHEVFERDGWVCGLCEEPVDRTLAHPHPMSASLDHIIPLSKGGKHSRDNTQCSHLTCNVVKGARLAA